MSLGGCGEKKALGRRRRSKVEEARAIPQAGQKTRRDGGGRPSVSGRPNTDRWVPIAASTNKCDHQRECPGLARVTPSISRGTSTSVRRNELRETLKSSAREDIQ